MNNTDKNNRLDGDDFSYRVSKDKKVFIFWCGNQTVVLKGKESEKFLAKIAQADQSEAQMIMAKLSGGIKMTKRARYLHSDKPLGSEA